MELLSHRFSFAIAVRIILVLTIQIPRGKIGLDFTRIDMSIYKFLLSTKNIDPRTEGYLRDAHMMGFQQLRTVLIQDLYFIECQLMQEDLQQLALKLLTDPVTQSVVWMELPGPLSSPASESVILEVALRPGVTDPIAEQIVRAARELNLHGVQRAATGQRFIL
ncbi:MAG: hypothetical protein ABIQ77_11765, partial [Anaerolineales bacterium]